MRLCRIFLSLFSFFICGAFGQDLFLCRNFQVRSLAADPVKALASLAVEQMEVEKIIMIYIHCDEVSIWLFLQPPLMMMM